MNQTWIDRLREQATKKEKPEEYKPELVQSMKKSNPHTKSLKAYKKKYFSMPFYQYDQVIEYLTEEKKKGNWDLLTLSSKCDGELAKWVYDGSLPEGEKVKAYSLQGRERKGKAKVFEDISSILSSKGIKKMEFLGEIYVRNGEHYYVPFNVGMSIMRKPTSKEDEDRISCDAYELLEVDGKDILKEEANYLKRLERLEKIFPEFGSGKNVHVTPYVTAKSVADVEKAWKKFVEPSTGKGEGLVIGIFRKVK